MRRLHFEKEEKHQRKPYMEAISSSLGQKERARKEMGMGFN